MMHLKPIARADPSAVSNKPVLIPCRFQAPAIDQAVANGLADRTHAAMSSGFGFQRGEGWLSIACRVSDRQERALWVFSMGIADAIFSSAHGRW
jgi:hypothetical protein